MTHVRSPLATPAWLFLFLLACGGESGPFGGGGLGGGALGGSSGDNSFNGRVHSVSEDGVRHASGNNTPFLCRDGGSSATCPDDVWPATEELSCDASGCHGSYDYDPATPASERALDGDVGPSCYDCHGTEWNGTKTANGSSGGGGGGDDDGDDDD